MAPCLDAAPARHAVVVQPVQALLALAPFGRSVVAVNRLTGGSTTVAASTVPFSRIRDYFCPSVHDYPGLLIVQQYQCSPYDEPVHPNS